MMRVFLDKFKNNKLECITTNLISFKALSFNYLMPYKT